MSEFSNLSSSKLLRSVDLLSKLTILQLSRIADCLSEVSFSDGQIIVDKNGDLQGLYIIQKGLVKINFDTETVRSQNASSLLSENQIQEYTLKSNIELSVNKTEGNYFGFGKMKSRSRDSSTRFPKDSVGSIDPSTLSKVKLSDLERRTCIYSTDCSEVGLVLLKESENLLSLKRFSKQKIKNFAKEAQVLKEKDLVKSLSASACVPQLVCTCADKTHAAMLLNTCIACPIASILHSPLDELCCFCCHFPRRVTQERGSLQRCFSRCSNARSVGIFAACGLQIWKEIIWGRTFTICGTADYLAPEIVQGQGHGFPADWWALGVLIYFILQGDLPFGSWRESEIDTFAKIAKGQFTLPQDLSPEAVDLVTKLTDNKRLGGQGADSVKSHPWFDTIDWKAVTDHSFPVPHEIISRINQRLDNHAEAGASHPFSPVREIEGLNTPEWLEDW